MFPMRNEKGKVIDIVNYKKEIESTERGIEKLKKRIEKLEKHKEHLKQLDRGQ